MIPLEKRFQNFSISGTLAYVLIILSAFAYLFLGYYVVRVQTLPLLMIYVFLFVVYLLLQKSELTFIQLLFAGILFRIILIIAIPELSDDFYRFIWDGRMMEEGINPFSYLPSEVINHPNVYSQGLDQQLFINLNSPEYYSIYPPVDQFVFWVAAKLGGDSMLWNVVIIRVFILMAEFGSIYLMLRIFRILHFNQHYTLLYILNPLVIIELTGNLHFEAVMIFFTLLGYYLLKREQYELSGIGFGLAIGSKLTPLIFLPFFIKRLKPKNWLTLFVSCGLTVVLIFLPFMSADFTDGFFKSLQLYFQRFEFNASIFYVIRGIGFWTLGYDVIQVAGPILGIITLGSIIAMAVTQKPEKLLIMGVFMLSLFLYFTLATIVHPWYVIPLIAFSIFTKYRFPIVWSFFIFFTYVGYTAEGFQENYWIVILEYIMVWATAAYELYHHWPFGKRLVSKNVRN